MNTLNGSLYIQKNKQSLNLVQELRELIGRNSVDLEYNTAGDGFYLFIESEEELTGERVVKIEKKIKEFGQFALDDDEILVYLDGNIGMILVKSQIPS